MEQWQEIWEGDGAKRLWSIPDRGVQALVSDWKAKEEITRVLDVGCGIGRHIDLLSRQGFEAYGMDHSDSGITICRRWLESQGRTATLWCGEMEDIPYPNGYFDAVIAFNSIYHGTTERVKAMVALMHSKLRGGGICYVTLPSRENRMYGRGESVESHTYISPGMFPHVFNGAGEAGIPHHFSSEGEVRDFFRAFRIESLLHQELELALSRDAARPAEWLRVSKAFFWRVLARRA